MCYSEINEIIINYRREFHKYAESGWTEFRTSARIAEILEALGYEVRVGEEIIDAGEVLGRFDENIINENIKRALNQGANEKWIKRMNRYTGVIGRLKGREDGKTVVLRFDIDANEISESTEDSHFPYKEGFVSINKGIMHACGHDGHTAVGLGIAHIFSNLQDKFKGELILLFQPAEEGVRGAKALLSKNFVDKVDYFFSGHIGLGLKKGQFASSTKGFLCTRKLDVKYTGKSAHAGMAPNEGNNALLAAATAVLNLHAIAPHKDGSSRINVGLLNSGEGRNSIPSISYMQIETRGETEEINNYVYERAIKVIKASADMYNVKFTISNMGESTSCFCDSKAVDIVNNCVKGIDEINDVKEEYFLGVSEDASLILNEVQRKGGKGDYMVFGTSISAGHHNENFDFDEKILLTAVKVYEKIINKIMND